MVPPPGIIITVTVLVAASLAAYENPQVRAWIDRTRHKIAMGLHALGDEVRPRPPPHRDSTDRSMHEEKGEPAEARRRQAIEEIRERGRMLEEKSKRRKLSATNQARTPSFDTLVDDDGTLLPTQGEDKHPPTATSSALEPSPHPDKVRHRGGLSESPEEALALGESVDSPLALRHLTQLPSHEDSQGNTFESHYEQEMREAWNIPLAERRIEITSSHASESLIELTPTTEGVPDPDFSIPSAEYLQRSDYFSAASNSTRTLSDALSEASAPLQSTFQLPMERHISPSQTASIGGAPSDIHMSEADESADDLLSEVGDGVRTPASVWTEVDSTVSGDLHG